MGKGKRRDFFGEIKLKIFREEGVLVKDVWGEEDDVFVVDSESDVDVDVDLGSEVMVESEEDENMNGRDDEEKILRIRCVES